MDLFFDQEFRSLIPPLHAEERKRLENSLITEGNRDPIVVWKEKQIVIDGHNRYDICHAYSIPLKPPIEMSFKDRDDVIIWILKNQLERRNLERFSYVSLCLKLDDLLQRKGLQNKARAVAVTNTVRSSPDYLKSDKLEVVPLSERVDSLKEIAKIANVSRDTVAKVKVIEARATPEQKRKLVDGTATIHKIYTQVKREEVKEQVKRTDWPSGKFRVVYADPPWAYGNTMPDGTSQPDDHYPLMPLMDIIALPVPDITLDNAVLFLWATSPILEDAFKVINAWGFKYKAIFVWDKVKHNMGHYNSVRHEFLLIAIKGSCPPDECKLFDSVQTFERNGHSEKPEIFRDIINTLYKYGPRVELFARKQTEGWVTYGNQIS